MKFEYGAALFILAIIGWSPVSASALEMQKWKGLPEIPSLSQPSQEGTVSTGNAKIWFATFGDDKHAAVTLLHGGGVNSNYWGHLIRELSSRYRVILIDSRGHGRSTFGGKPFSYAAMADDVVAVLNHLKVDKTAIVGWSDGTNIGFYLTLKYPERISGHYAFAGNSNPGGMQRPPPASAFHVFAERSPLEFKKLSPVPAEFAKIQASLSAMWKTQPQLTKSDLKKISVPTWIVHAEHDEVVRQAHAREIAASIPKASFVLLKGVSHFALLQDPAQFNASVQEFLQSLP